MYVTQVKLNNFRNYTDKTFAFSQGLNVIAGPNAAGKTNLLESVYMCGLGTSPRVARDKDVIKWGEKGAYIHLELQTRFRAHTVDMYIDGREKKRVAIDGIPITRLAQLIGTLGIVFFSPDELKLVKDAPVERRRFMDVSLSQQSLKYLFALSRYNAVLLRRNKLLKTMLPGDNLKNSLQVWDMQLSQEGARVIKARYEFARELKKFAAQKHGILSGGKENLSVEYESDAPDGAEGQIAEVLLQKLFMSYEKDCSVQYTTVGPHKDDIKISLDGVDVRKFGSQGQQRTAALSLKLAEISLFKDNMGEEPVLLLDDVLSELDEDRRKTLLKETSSFQTIITCTEYNEGVTPSNIIKIGNP